MRADATSAYADAIETIERDQLEVLQQERLIEIVAHAYGNQPLARAVWDEARVKPGDITSADDFRKKAPFTSKRHIREFRERSHDPWGGLLAVDPAQVGSVTASSGTTGRPSYAPGRAKGGPDTFLRVAWMVGARPGDYTVNFGGPAVGWPDLDITTIHVQHSPADRDLARLVDVLFEFRPTFLFFLSNPTIVALDDYAASNGIDLVDAFSSVRGAVRGGEPAGAAIRAITNRWQLDRFDMTAGGDVDIAVDCAHHQGNHVWEDVGFIECLDITTGEPVPNGGRGELVVTSLLNRVGPLIRNRTDDLVEFTQERCACGRTHGRIRTIGRLGDITSVRGSLVMPIDVWPVIENHAETTAAFFQIVRPERDVDVLRIRVGYAPSALEGGLGDLEWRVRDALVEALSVPVEVELIDNDELMRRGPAAYKIPRVVNE